MKIVVIGGSGLIGSKLVRKLLEHGHQAVSASLDSGVNTITGAGVVTTAWLTGAPGGTVSAGSSGLTSSVITGWRPSLDR